MGKDLDMRLSGWAQPNHMSPWKQKLFSVEVRMVTLLVLRMGEVATSHRKHRASRKQGGIGLFPRAHNKECSPADTLSFTQWDLVRFPMWRISLGSPNIGKRLDLKNSYSLDLKQDYFSTHLYACVLHPFFLWGWNFSTLSIVNYEQWLLTVQQPVCFIY